MKYIVSDEYKFVFFVNQKVACTSIKNAIHSLFPIDWESYAYINRLGRKKLRVHLAFDQSGHQLDKPGLLGALNEGRLDGYFRFGFVRNPWDRLYSCYSQKINKRHQRIPDDRPLQQPGHDPRAFRTGMAFEDFVEVVHRVPDNEADNHFRSQYHIFYEDDSTETPLAQFIGRFESLAEDFRTVTDRLGLAGTVELPHALKSRNREKYPYTEFYNRRTRELVAERYARDIELFDYRFGS